MTKTICGNLPAMSLNGRKRRGNSGSNDFAPGRRRLSAAWLVVGALTFGGCDDAPSREPVPNPAANSEAKDDGAGGEGEKKSDDEAAIR